MLRFYFLVVHLVFLSFAEDSMLSLDKRWVNVSLRECRHPDYHLCRNTMNCIYGEYLCDGSPDCLEGDDEADCLNHICPKGTLKCSDSGACIGRARVCNGCLDCNNGDDEKECPSNGGRCVGNKFYCSKSDMCLPARWACDGVTGQCPGDEDEWCDISHTQDVLLDSEEKIISFNMINPGTHPAPHLKPPKILIQSWRVKSTKGNMLYVKPLNVSLGTVCGPSMIEIFEEGQIVAEICGNSVNPWPMEHLAISQNVNASFYVKFRFFNDFSGDEFRSFDLKFWEATL